MDRSYLSAHPKRRDENLIVREVDGEVVVYDRDRHKAHCLNPEAARLWHACDGERDGAGILRHLYGEDAGGEHEAAMLLGLRQLEKNHLLEPHDGGSVVGSLAHSSRRELLARFGTAAAVTVGLPAVMSIVSPTPAEASSCFASGTACSSSSECCSGLCLPAGTCA